MPSERNLNTLNGSATGAAPQITPHVYDVDFSRVKNNVEYPLLPNAPAQAIVLVRVTDGGIRSTSRRRLHVHEVTEDGGLVAWEGTERVVNFKQLQAEGRKEWCATLLIAAIDATGSLPQGEAKVARVKLKGTIFVDDE